MACDPLILLSKEARPAHNPFIIKMAGRGGEFALNLIFIGATLLLVMVVAWPYIGSLIWNAVLFAYFPNTYMPWVGCSMGRRLQRARVQKKSYPQSEVGGGQSGGGVWGFARTHYLPSPS